MTDAGNKIFGNTKLSSVIGVATVGGQSGHGSPKFLAYLVVLRFEKRLPKPNTIARLKSKISLVPKFRVVGLVGYGTVTPTPCQSYSNSVAAVKPLEGNKCTASISFDQRQRQLT